MKSKYSTVEKFQIVVESFTDNVTQAEICRKYGIYPVQIVKWRKQFILGGNEHLLREGILIQGMRRSRILIRS